MDDDLLGFTADENRLFKQCLLHNQQVTFNLIANFMRETRESIKIFMRENRERKCCGCHCVKGKCSENFKTISIGDLRNNAAGDLREDVGDGMFENIGDDAVGEFGDGMVGELMDGGFVSGTSNSAGNSGNMEQLGEEGDGFLQEALQIKSGSSSVGNFAKNLVDSIFQPRELEGRNWEGQGGKCY